PLIWLYSETKRSPIAALAFAGLSWNGSNFALEILQRPVSSAKLGDGRSANSPAPQPGRASRPSDIQAQSLDPREGYGPATFRNLASQLFSSLLSDGNLLKFREQNPKRVLQFIPNMRSRSGRRADSAACDQDTNSVACGNAPRRRQRVA